MAFRVQCSKCRWIFETIYAIFMKIHGNVTDSPDHQLIPPFIHSFIHSSQFWMRKWRVWPCWRSPTFRTERLKCKKKKSVTRLHSIISSLLHVQPFPVVQKRVFVCEPAGYVSAGALTPQHLIWALFLFIYLFYFFHLHQRTRLIGKLRGGS